MPKSNPKLALSVSRDIPFDKLVLSQSNVRRIKAGVGIEDLAEDQITLDQLMAFTVNGYHERQEQASRDALQAAYDALVAEHEDSPELPDEVDERLGELETAIEALDQRPLAYDANEVARPGAFVSIAPDGSVRIERGFVRPEDELPIEPKR